MGDAPPVTGLFELVLEVADLAAAERFYHDVIGLPVAARWEEPRPAVWLSLGGEGFLGLWPPRTGGAAAIHGGTGGRQVHYAVRVPIGTIDAMRDRLVAFGYTVEERDFGRGDLAIYTRDPDDNVLELTERTTLWDGSLSAEARQRG